MTDKITSRQRKQFLRIAEDALDAAKLTNPAAQRAIAKGGTLKEWLKAKLLELAAEEQGKTEGDTKPTRLVPTEEPEAHKAACAIMGVNFHGVPEAARVFGGVTEADMAALAVIPFDEATLRECANTHLLVADLGHSIVDIRSKVARGAFRSYENAGYNREVFATKTDGVCWRLVRKTEVPNSTDKWWKDQRAMLAANDEVPTARTMVYAIMLHFAVTGERLFHVLFVRTSDVVSFGFRVGVGVFGLVGLLIGIGYWFGGENPGGDVGVASSRKSIAA